MGHFYVNFTVASHCVFEVCLSERKNQTEGLSSTRTAGLLPGVRFPTGTGNFSLLHRVQNGYEAHPVAYLMGAGCNSPGSKAAGS
jgi:hypothetical protein